jgi:hypothetical protein
MLGLTMLNQFILAFIISFVFSGCAERGMMLPVSYKNKTHIIHSIQESKTNNQIHTKTVSPAYSKVKPIQTKKNQKNTILDNLQNKIAGAFVFIIAAALIL